MKLLYITSSFHPDIGPNARIVNEIVQDHAAMGHEVTVLCGMPHHPHMVVPPEYRGKLFAEERHGAARVLRTWIYAHPAKTPHGKILNYISFMITCILGGLKLKTGGARFDFIFVISPPLLEGVSGWVLGRLFRAPFLFNVQDIYPDIAVDHGVITNPRLIRALTRVERFIYRKAAVVSVICEGFRRTLMRKGVPEDKLVIVPNWVNTGFYMPGDRLTRFRGENGLSESDFVVLFAGTIGYSQGLTFMLEAAEELRGTPDIKFLIVGTGADKQTLVDFVAERGLKNVAFHDPVPQARMPEVIATADACLVSLRKGKSTTTIPCKTYEVMASGRPILAAVDVEGDNWELIRTASAGVHVEPENSGALAGAILELYRDREAAARYGGNGRAHAEAHCSREVWTRFYATLFEKHAGRGRS
jgi:glycosyltransferase involved in cell wall biosynthesis